MTPLRAGGRHRPHRPPHLQHPRLRARRHLQPVPVGVPGELYIGGDGLARGYLEPPRAHRRALRPRPLQPHPGARLYRTGDLARWLRRRHPRVPRPRRLPGEGARLPHRAGRNRGRAAPAPRACARPSSWPARTCPATSAWWPTSCLRRPGARRRPRCAPSSSSSCPSTWCPRPSCALEALPLTPNGKVDRKALPAPDATPSGADAYVAPRTPTEEQLAALWAEVLGVPRVGADDDFFELGGHSLLATQRRLPHPLRLRAWSCPCAPSSRPPPLAALAAPHRRPRLQAPSGLGAAAARARASRRARCRCPSPSSGCGSSTSSSPAAPPTTSRCALRLRGPLDVDALQRAPRRARAPPRGPAHHLRRARRASPSRSSHPRPTLPLRAGGPAATCPPPRARPRPAQLAAEEAAASLRPRHAARCCAPRCCAWARDEHVLLAHACTTSSPTAGPWACWCARWPRSTRPSSTGQPSPLPPLPVQYADYAVWQRAVAPGRGAATRSSTTGAAARRRARALELPTDSPRPAVQTFRGASLPVRAARGALRVASRPSASARASRPSWRCWPPSRCCCHRYSGQDDIVVGSPIAGRTRAELEGLIGFFVNTLVLRSRLRRRPLLPRAAARRCARPPWAPTPTRTCPSRSSSRSSSPQRDLSRSPLFQVMFALQNAPGRDAARCRASRCSPLRASSTTPPSSTWTLDLAETPRGLHRHARATTPTCSSAATVARMAWPLPASLLEAARRQPRAPLVRAAAARRGRAPAAAGRLERHALRLPARRHHPRRSSRRRRARTPDAIAVEFGDAAPHLRRARRARQPARPPPAPPGRAAPTSCVGAVPRALAGARRRPARHPQGRRRLRPAGPGLPARAPGLHAGGRARPRLLVTTRALRRRAARRGPRRPCVLEDADAGSPGRRTAPAPRRHARQPRLRHLHLGLHRPAQGRVHRRTAASLRTRPAARDYADFGARRAACSTRRPSPSTPPPSSSGAPLLHGARARRLPPHGALSTWTSCGQVARSATRVTTLWLTAGLFAQMVRRPASRRLRPRAPAAHRRRRRCPPRTCAACSSAAHCPSPTCYGPTESTVFATCRP